MAQPWMEADCRAVEVPAVVNVARPEADRCPSETAVAPAPGWVPAEKETQPQVAEKGGVGDSMALQ